MRMAGLGLLDVRSGRQETRSVGDVVADMTEGLGLLVGFENHRGWTELGPDAAPLGVVRSGVGNGAGMPIEGAVQGSVLGTYLHGPVLMLNPQLADLLLEQVVGTLPPFEDALANASRADRLRRCGLTPSGDAAAAAR
jgi:CobQ-like glutamine amidotransferase family enzyme